MSKKKLITVFGATGAQGGGLVHAILSDPDGDFAVRAVTRDAGSEKARALAEAGAEVVEADLTDPASLDRALEGAHGVFAVTFFWEHLSPEREKQDVRNLARASAKAGVKHAVWSTLEDTRNWVALDDDRMPTLGGKYKVPHFDAKGEADAYWAEEGVPTTYLLTTFYWENLIHFGMQPRRDANGTLVLALPMGDAKLSGIAAEDIGRSAYGIFRKGEETIGRRIGIAGDHLTGAEMARALSEALGEPVVYEAIPFETYRSLGFPGADDLGNMFQFYHDFADYFVGARPLDRARALNPSLQSFRAWLAGNKHRIPVEAAASVAD